MKRADSVGNPFLVLGQKKYPLVCWQVGEKLVTTLLQLTLPSILCLFHHAVDNNTASSRCRTHNKNNPKPRAATANAQSRKLQAKSDATKRPTKNDVTESVDGWLLTNESNKFTPWQSVTSHRGSSFKRDAASSYVPCVSIARACCPTFVEGPQTL